MTVFVAVLWAVAALSGNYLLILQHATESEVSGAVRLRSILLGRWCQRFDFIGRKARCVQTFVKMSQITTFRPQRVIEIV